MKSYFVTLRVLCAGHSHQAVLVVGARSRNHAESHALMSQCIGILGVDAWWTYADEPAWKHPGIVDLGGTFHYSVESCTEIKAQHKAILETYF